MRTAIDARWIFEEISGVGEYTRQLIRHLPEIDTSVEYLLIFDSPELLERTAVQTGFREAPNVKTRLVPYGPFALRNQLALGGLLKAEGVDVYHSTNYMLPLLPFPRHRAGRIRCVSTIHDVIPLLFHEHAPRSKKARLFPVYKRLMIEVGARSDIILTDSRASRADVVAQLRLRERAADKVRVVYCGVPEAFTPDAPPTARPDAAGSTGNGPATLLYVGRSDPYKNIETLIRALALVRNQHGIDAKLLVVGPIDPRYPEPRRVSVMLGVADAIEWRGYVRDDELPGLYRAADVLVHASRYEGFGLQVLEAMACGTPVICSNAASLPEVAGDAAILLAPDDIAGFAAAARRVLREPDVATRMRESGIRQAARFSWRKTAADVLNAYRDLM